MTTIIVSFLSLKQSNRQFFDSLQATKEVKSTETLLKAVELLSSDSRATRMGALVIINDVISQKSSESPFLIEMVLNYLKDRASDVERRAFMTKGETVWPPIDVVTGLQILSRYSEHTSRSSGSHARIDLTGICLRDANLTEIQNMDRWVLARTDLQGSDLSHISIQGADLRGADLRSAKLDGSILKGSDLRGAQLSNAYLSVDISGADVRETDFSLIQPPFELDWSKAKGNHSTLLPRTISRPSNW